MDAQLVFRNARSRGALILCTALLSVSCATNRDAGLPPVKPVAQVDLQRYMGDWYVIANIPNRAERGCHDSIERYALRPDGRIDNWFECRDKSFEAPLERRLTTIATIHDKASNAEWRVRIFKVIPVAYLVLDLDPEYQWAVVGHPSRRYGWILAREKSLPEATYSGILERLRQQGYDVTQFEKVPQRAGG
jgi:apolipoprotein D and lipocalin family protein